MNGVALLQALTNLALAAPGTGLPEGWELRRVREAPAPRFAVTAERTIAIESSSAAGFASYRLATPLTPDRAGAIAWRWRTATPLPRAVLRRRPLDDCPVRVYLVFGDGRIIFYSWGNREPRGDRFASWTGGKRQIVVLRGAADADGAWREERQDPFADYRLVFGRAPREVVAVGVAADTEQLAEYGRAEVAELRWMAGDP